MESVANSPLLSAPGAIAAPDESVDVGVPWHFGDPPAEQRAAARNAVVIDRSHRGVITVSGADRLTWLHSLTSQHFTNLLPDQGSEALILDAQGRVEHHLVVGQSSEAVLLDTERESVSAIIDYLRAMVFWSAVEPQDATAEYAILSLLGPSTVDVLTHAGVVVSSNDYGLTSLPDGGFARMLRWPQFPTVDLVVPRAALTQWWQRLVDAGARAAGSLTYEALRVEALRPRLGIDTDNRTIPHEVNWIGVAVHLDKGCYRGQETVARVHNLGKPPRQLVLLHLDGSADALPEKGDSVFLDGRAVGRLGSVVSHHELGPIALALVKRSVPATANLLVGELDQAVAATIDPDSVSTTPQEQPGKAAIRRLRG